MLTPYDRHVAGWIPLRSLRRFTSFRMTRGGGSLAIAFNTCVTEPLYDSTHRHLVRDVLRESSTLRHVAGDAARNGGEQIVDKDALTVGYYS